LQQIVSENGGKSLKSVENPRTEGILLCQCIRISASIRETFRAGGAFSSIPVMGQRDLTIKWAIGAGKAKEPLIQKGLIVDDGGAFFGWGVEQGHLGKTEIFCKFDPQNLEAKAAVEKWNQEQSARAFSELGSSGSSTSRSSIFRAPTGARKASASNVCRPVRAPFLRAVERARDTHLPTSSAR